MLNKIKNYISISNKSCLILLTKALVKLMQKHFKEWITHWKYIKIRVLKAKTCDSILLFSWLIEYSLYWQYSHFEMYLKLFYKYSLLKEEKTKIINHKLTSLCVKTTELIDRLSWLQKIFLKLRKLNIILRVLGRLFWKFSF